MIQIEVVMTQRGSVGQGDMERALKACKRAGFEQERVHINLRDQTIDIIVGERLPEARPVHNPWDDE
jgi:hypothetical protein